MKKLELVLNILSAILCIATIILMVKNRIERVNAVESERRFLTKM